MKTDFLNEHVGKAADMLTMLAMTSLGEAWDDSHRYTARLILSVLPKGRQEINALEKKLV